MLKATSDLNHLVRLPVKLAKGKAISSIFFEVSYLE
jgi:hypothetical protein